jgi:hypothetical protein
VSALSPGLLGAGFAFRDLDLLLRAALPAGLLAQPLAHRDPLGFPPLRGLLDPIVLGLGALSVVLQALLTGGILGVFRAPRGGWTVRGLVLGSGFYFGRLLRVSLLALAAAAAVFAVNAPPAPWVDGVGGETGSARTANALVLGRHALFLLALVLVHMVSSFAEVFVVCEERLSVGLAFASSLGFCARHLVAAVGQYAVVLALGAGLLVLFGSLDRPLEGLIVLSGGSDRPLSAAGGARVVPLCLSSALAAATIALRLGLLASQVELRAARGR